MTANDFLTLVTQLFFALLSAITLLDYVRHRDKTRQDIALMFTALGVATFAPLVIKVIGVSVVWLNALTSLALVAQPYLTLRIVRYFRPLPANVRIVALGGMIAVGSIVLFIPAPVPGLVILVAVAYFVGVDGYAMTAFIRGALTTTGVVQQRLRFAAAGSGLLVLALLLAGLIALVPALAAPGGSLILLVAVGSALSFYIGFAPPRWLGRAWQLEELNSYLTRISRQTASERSDTGQSMTELCIVARRAVGGIAAGIVQRAESSQAWVLSYHVGPFPQASLTGAAVFARAWNERVPALLRASDKPTTSDHRTLLEGAGADTLLVVPIATSDRIWGLLPVFLRYGSLFIEDDLNLLTLLSQQSSIFLENGVLVEQQSAYAKQLERTLELTQAMYETSRALLTARGHNQILEAVFNYARRDHANVASLFALEVDAAGRPEWATVTARLGAEGLGSPVGTRQHLPDIPFTKYWIDTPNDVLLLGDVFEDSRFDDSARAVARRAGFRGMALLPLTLDGAWLGLFSLTWVEPHRFEPVDQHSYSALSTLVTTALESERLREAEYEALQRLARQEAHYRILAENVSDAISRHMPDGTITYISSSSANLLGYTPDELTGRTTWAMIHPEDRATVGAAFERDLHSTETTSTVYRIQHRDGHYLWAETTSRSIRDEAGNPEIIAVTRDISRRKEAEEAVQKLNVELEHRARQLAAANRELEAFSYSVSHDLRAPLRALSGFSQALEEDQADNLGDDGKDYLRRIRAASVRMGHNSSTICCNYPA